MGCSRQVRYSLFAFTRNYSLAKEKTSGEMNPDITRAPTQPRIQQGKGILIMYYSYDDNIP